MPKRLVIGAYSSITATIERLKTSGECDTNRCTVINNQIYIDAKENSTMKKYNYSNEIANVVKNVTDLMSCHSSAHMRCHRSA